MSTDTSPIDSPVEPKGEGTGDPPRSWWQFSLRTFFIAVALLAIGFVVVERFDRPRRIVEAIRSQGGSVYFESDVASRVTDYTPPSESWLPKAYREHVKEVWFAPKGANGLVPLLVEFPELTWIDLEETDVEDASLAQLARLPHLRRLDLRSTAIGDNGLANLRDFPELQDLLLSHTRVTDAGLRHLRGHETLRMLFLDQTSVTDAGLADLSDMPSLHWLNLAGTQVTGRGFAQLRNVESLDYLDLFGCDLTEEGAQGIARHTGLAILDFGGTDVSDRSLASLRPLTNLKELRIMATPIGDDGLAHLATLPALRFVDLSRTKTTQAGWDRFQALRSDVELRGPLVNNRLRPLAPPTPASTADPFGAASGGDPCR